MPNKRKAPPGCFWRGDKLWGKKGIDGKDKRWPLHTDNPKVAAAQYLKDVERLTAEVHHGAIARRSFAEALSAWATWAAKNIASKNTLRRYTVSLGQLEPFVASKFIDEVNGKLIAEIVAERGKTVTNATIKRDLGALSSVMNHEIDEGHIESNPVLPRLKRVKERRDPIVLPSDADIALVIKHAADSMASPDIIRAALATGARQAELVNARCKQLDLDRQRFTVIGKRNKMRTLDLAPFEGVSVFGSIPRAADGAYLFRDESASQLKFVSEHFHRLTAAVAKEHPEFQRFTFHHLRHVHAVKWLQSGRSIYDLQQRLGHSSIKTTEVYLAYLTPEETRHAKGVA